MSRVCLQCGFVSTPESVFCGICGSWLIVNSETMRFKLCPNRGCRRLNKEEFVLCIHCYKSLDGAEILDLSEIGNGEVKEEG